ncbi:hypothetical protein B0H14DRAFT_3467156 [Mycena olivaceomarginata]|nr:hypothetical protein B0H14DRAFT_3467156 [Mycena olivaceomarginata]
MSIPCTIPTGSFLLSDFQGFCLTVDITGASPFSPIITEGCSRRLPALPQQTWSLATVNHGRVLVSGLSQESGQTVVVAEGSNGQAITAGGTSFGFNITCVPVDANSVTDVLHRTFLVDNLVGTEITLTSSQAEGQGDTAQAAGPVNPFFKLQIAGPSSQSSSSKFNNFHFHDDPQPAPNPPLPSPLATYVQNPPRTSPLFRYRKDLTLRGPAISTNIAVLRFCPLRAGFLDAPVVPFGVHRMALASKAAEKDVGMWFGPSAAGENPCGRLAALVISVATDGTLYQTEVFAASHSPFSASSSSSAASVSPQGHTSFSSSPRGPTPWPLRDAVAQAVPAGFVSEWVAYACYETQTIRCTGCLKGGGWELSFYTIRKLHHPELQTNPDVTCEFRPLNSNKAVGLWDVVCWEQEGEGR